MIRKIFTKIALHQKVILLVLLAAAVDMKRAAAP